MKTARKCPGKAPEVAVAAAALVPASIPAGLLLIFAQRHIASGAINGAIK
ncbi:hypothetical protein [Nonomuraea sp. NPDC003201]